MPNTHLIADTMAEIMAREEDLLPACVISTTWPTVPVSSMTLAAFTTQAYVRDGQHLVYCDQPAITLPLSGSNGTYWLAISRDVSTAYATWTRRAGSQYLWQLAGARPPDVDGLLVFASVTVAGGVITAVTPAPGVTRAERWRTLAGLGTMAQQNASAVAITGGTATGLGQLSGPAVGVLHGTLVTERSGNDVIALHSGVMAAGGTNRWGVFHTGDAPSYFAGRVVIGSSSIVPGGVMETIYYPKDTLSALKLRQLVNDTGGGYAVLFANVADGFVGSISTTASTTAYNTSSDVRLKHAIAPLAGALDVVRRLRPITHLWNADDSRGYGFLAHELQREVPTAVTGQPDEVNDDGSIKPQQVDHSKLVPWLTAALQETLAALDALTARVTALEAALGV